MDAGDDGDDDVIAYKVTVVATDPSRAPGMVPVTVNLKNVNEGAKFGKDAPKELTLWENEAGKQLLVPDADSSDNETDDADVETTPYDETKVDDLPEGAYLATDEDLVDNDASDRI